MHTIDFMCPWFHGSSSLESSDESSRGGERMNDRTKSEEVGRKLPSCARSSISGRIFADSIVFVSSQQSSK